ncbi:hypothetical protein EIP91_012370 [Steccherinum ochraceum]|uniref:Uncharacterized protein n=1 Tax=Steccherinum ochraceum TaxID=92696 RepID=A0A4R0RKM0_9APHY|nr:hypothetical protein EIP91_012370 [Steccherinum ochraceum]
MATTLQMSPEPLTNGPINLPTPQSASEFYSRGLPVTQLDFKDTRYPTLPKTASPPVMAASYRDRVEEPVQAESSRRTWADYSSPSNAFPPSGWFPDKSLEEALVQRTQPVDPRGSPVHPPPPQSHMRSTSNTYTAPSDPPGYTPASGRPEEQQRAQRMSSNSGGSAPNAEPSRPVAVEGIDDKPPPQQSAPDNMGQRFSTLDQARDRSSSFMPSSPRHPSLPLAGIGNSGASTSTIPPIIPLSSGPSYSQAMAIPISPKPRVYPQQPTYINPSPTTPAYAPPQVPKEEVCVECAMRDQDMADVDVTSPGVWERESDVMYEDLCRREAEEEMSGKSSSDHSSRPRAKGGLLTEPNLKLWLSVNPKEPLSRMQTLDTYVRAQRALLEVEAIAHARAMRESRQLDDRMRDAYSQLRRSAYELGSSPAFTDDIGGVRVKIPNSPSIPAGLPHGRDITLLENGMIVEHVDVRREERDKRREEKRERSRARKSSRSSRSGADVMSVYSLPIQAYPTDSGFFSNVRPDSRFSQSMSARPSSVLTGGNERPLTMLRAQSQASFSDMQSIGSASSPRRSKFFGLKNLTAGWRSSDSLAPSGSMIDMHVALQREQQLMAAYPQGAVDLSSNAPTLRLSQSWAQNEASPQPEPSETRSTKKTKGLKKIWKLVTGSSSKSVALGSQSRSLERPEDDMPLAPPPPLSYLVNGSRGRHISTPSLPSTNASPNGYMPYGSPPTAPSSLMPSPTSSRPSGVDKDLGHDPSSSRPVDDHDDRVHSGDYAHESDSRTRSSSRTLSSVNGPLTPATSPSQRPMSTLLSREKSLPPLPGESCVEFPNQAVLDGRPQTVFTYDPNGLSPGFTPPHAAFRSPEIRRQSFGGVSSKPAHPSPMATTVGPRLQAAAPPFTAREKFNEFGASNMSIGQWAPGQYSQPPLATALSEKPKKRKSKFGLGSLFGRKSMHGHGGDGLVIAETLEFPAFRTSHSDSPYEGYMNGPNAMTPAGYASPASTFASVNPGATRMSMMSSRRNLDLVDQDPDFVAYRYPSSDQRLDLAR